MEPTEVVCSFGAETGVTAFWATENTVGVILYNENGETPDERRAVISTMAGSAQFPIPCNGQTQQIQVVPIDVHTRNPQASTEGGMFFSVTESVIYP